MSSGNALCLHTVLSACIHISNVGQSLRSPVCFSAPLMEEQKMIITPRRLFTSLLCYKLVSYPLASLCLVNAGLLETAVSLPIPVHHCCRIFQLLCGAWQLVSSLNWTKSLMLPCKNSSHIEATVTYPEVKHVHLLIKFKHSFTLNVTKSNAYLIDEYFTINLSLGSERALKE